MQSKKVKNILVITGMVFSVVIICILSIAMQIKTVTLNYFGNITEVRTMTSTVEEFLSENNIYISDEMKVIPDISQEIAKKTKISIVSKVELASIDENSIINNTPVAVAKVVEEVVEIPYDVEKVETPSLFQGVSRVVTKGENGSKLTKYLVKTEEEKEIYKAEIESNVITQAINEVVEVGTAVRRGNSSIQVSSEVDENYREYGIALSSDLQKYTYNVCKSYGVSYELMLALMYVESMYNVNISSSAGATGLCQIMPANLNSLSASIGITNLYDPYDNILAGVYMMSRFQANATKYSDDTAFIEKYALNSYNMGEGGFISTCYNNGIIDRYYSTRVRSIRDRLITTGTI